MNLFNPEFDIPKMNRDASFHSKDVQKKRVTQKDKVLDAVQQLNNPSQRELHEFTNIPRHLIPDRLLQLIMEKKVEQSGSKLDQVTNKSVTTYKAVV